MRRLLTAVSALATGVLASGAARADQCKAVDTTIVTTFTPCAPNESPLGICTEGTIASGLLAGSTRFAVQTMTGTDTSVMYTGVLTVTARSGTVQIRDSGILNPMTGAFSEIEQVVSGTGRFKHLTGMLVSQGIQTATGFSGTLVGTLCHFNEGHGPK
jgi:hypothetical protein